MARLIDITGQRFGKLVVIRRAPYRYVGRGWVCRCDCGNTSTALGPNLRAGRSRSCGCGMSRPTHGMSQSKAYEVWTGMWTRVRSDRPNLKKHYKDRGITVCKRWRRFENFLADMGEPPKGMTLDRRNNDHGYSKANCRWATQAEQMQNTTRIVRVTFRGRTQHLAAWAREYGLSRGCLSGRLKRGLSIAEALGAQA